MRLASFVKERREGLGLSMSQLAALANCTKGHICGIERGKTSNPTTLTICLLAAALQMPAVDLFRVAAELEPAPPEAAGT